MQIIGSSPACEKFAAGVFKIDIASADSLTKVVWDEAKNCYTHIGIRGEFATILPQESSALYYEEYDSKTELITHSLELSLGGINDSSRNSLMSLIENNKHGFVALVYTYHKTMLVGYSNRFGALLPLHLEKANASTLKALGQQSNISLKFCSKDDSMAGVFNNL